MTSYLKATFLACAVLLALPLTTTVAKEQVYGWELMTEQERAEHRTRMQSFKTQQEREQYRMEHHKMMQERARQQGKTLPDKPQSQGKGMGHGGGKGGGRY